MDTCRIDKVIITTELQFRIITSKQRRDVVLT